MYTVSVIIPVYNGENYISKCLDSVLNQKFKNFEIIIINDGSTDNTEKILLEYENTYDFIKVISVENKGQGVARNLGAKNANSDYLYFMDSDDYLDSTCLQKLYQTIIDDCSDLVVCSYYRVDEGGNIVNTEMNLKSPTILNMNTSPWNKLFKKSKWEEFNIKFSENLWYEDLEASLCYLLVSDKVSWINEPLYYYVQRDNSSINLFGNKVEDIFQVLDNIYSFVLKNNLLEKKYNELEYFFMMHLILGHLSRCAVATSFKQRQKYIKRTKEYLETKFPTYRKNKYFKLTEVIKKPSFLSFVKYIGLIAFRMNAFNIILSIYNLKLKISPNIKRW